MNARLGFMAKIKETHQPPSEKPVDVVMVTKQIRFPEDLAEKLNMIATINKTTVAEVCDRLFRSIVDEEQRAAVERLASSIRKK